jgi:hypothetical protein
MSVEPGLTRRSVLAGAAAAGAASLLGPVAGLADSLLEPQTIFSLSVGSLAGESSVIVASRRFALVGVEWAAPATVRIELRARRVGGAWSRWAPASTLGHDPDPPARGGSLFGEPIWTGSADEDRPARRGPRFGEPIWTGPADEVQLRTAAGHTGARRWTRSAANHRSGRVGAEPGAL